MSVFGREINIGDLIHCGAFGGRCLVLRPVDRVADSFVIENGSGREQVVEGRELRKGALLICGASHRSDRSQLVTSPASTIRQVIVRGSALASSELNPAGRGV